MWAPRRPQSYHFRGIVWATSWAEILADPALLGVHAVMVVLFVGSLLYFPWNSWCSQTWIHWPLDDLVWKRPILRGLFAFYRFLSPFRLVAAYGVFPPNSSPPVKMIPVLEGSDDGERWEVFEYRHMPTKETSPPPMMVMEEEEEEETQPPSLETLVMQSKQTGMSGEQLIQ